MEYKLTLVLIDQGASAGATLATTALTCLKAVNGIVAVGGTTYRIIYGAVGLVKKVSAKGNARTHEYTSLMDEDLCRAGDGQWVFVDVVKKLEEEELAKREIVLINV